MQEAPAAARTAQRGHVVATLAARGAVSGVRASGRGESRCKSQGRLGAGRWRPGRAPQPRWAWLGGQGPADRALLVAGTFAHVPRARFQICCERFYSQLACTTDMSVKLHSSVIYNSIM